jgi:hypothetical protein
MPKYRNTKSHYINFAVKFKSYNLGPNAIIDTDILLDNIDGLKRIDKEQFYNPLFQRHIFEGAKDSIHEFDVDPFNVQIIKTIVAPGSVDLYINDILNTPPTRVSEKYIFDVRSYKRIEKIIIQCLQRSEIEIYMYKHKESFF